MTSHGIPAFKGFASLLLHLPVQQQSCPSGPGGPRAPERTLSPLLGQLLAT